MSDCSTDDSYMSYQTSTQSHISSGFVAAALFLAAWRHRLDEHWRTNSTAAGVAWQYITRLIFRSWAISYSKLSMTRKQFTVTQVRDFQLGTYLKSNFFYTFVFYLFEFDRRISGKHSWVAEKCCLGVDLEPSGCLNVIMCFEGSPLKWRSEFGSSV